MKKRVLSAAFLLAVMCAFVLFSEVTRLIFFFAVGIMCSYEYCARASENGICVIPWVFYGMIGVSLVLSITHCGPMTYISTFMFSICIALFSAVISGKAAGEGIIYTVAGLAYPGVAILLMMIISVSGHWHQSLALGFFSSIICDTFCLLGGSRFGKHKLCPEVSPNKTWEGSICGAASSLISGVLVWLICRLFAPLPLWFCMVTAFLSSTTGQIGDLAESMLKRHFGIKDFSNLIPGHGGMFDRADSIMFAVPTAYFCLYCVEYFGII